MNGEFLHDNLLETSGVAFSGANWTLPLTNLLDRQMVARPARCTTPGAATIRVDFGRAVTVSRWFFAHLTTTLGATYSVKASSTAAHSGDLLTAAPARIIARAVSSVSLPWDEPGWWRGIPRQTDIEQYPRHLWIRLERTRARYWEITLSDPANASGTLDVGYAMAGTPVTVEYNYDLGRRRLREQRSVVEYTPGGGIITSRRAPLRGQAVTFGLLSEAEAGRLYDMGQSRDTLDPVVFVPRPLDHRDGLRDIYPARLVSAMTPQLEHPGIWSVAVETKELIA